MPVNKYRQNRQVDRLQSMTVKSSLAGLKPRAFIKLCALPQSQLHQTEYGVGGGVHVDETYPAWPVKSSLVMLLTSAVLRYSAMDPSRVPLSASAASDSSDTADVN